MNERLWSFAVDALALALILLLYLMDVSLLEFLEKTGKYVNQSLGF